MSEPTAPRRTDVSVSGFGMVAAGAALWGTDALFRRGLALELPASTVVFLEHVVLAAITLPFLWKGRAELHRLGRVDWISALVIGAGSSTLATVAFTAAFRYGDPTTPLLLQKIQPLVAVVAARFLLGERILPRFGWFLFAGLAGAYFIAFPNPTTVSISAVAPALLAALAAALWGLGTVLGRRLSSPLSFRTLTALRFAIGLPAAAVIVAAVDPTSVASVSRSELGRRWLRCPLSRGWRHCFSTTTASDPPSRQPRPSPSWPSRSLPLPSTMSRSVPR